MFGLVIGNGRSLQTQITVFCYFSLRSFLRDGGHHSKTSARIVHQDTLPRVHPRYSESEAGEETITLVDKFAERGPYL